MSRHAFSPTHQRDFLAWPFFDPGHRAFVQDVDEFADGGALDNVDHRQVDASCRRLVAGLGKAGLLRACVPAAYGGLASGIESRRLALAREALAYRDGLADFSFAMQGLGSGRSAWPAPKRSRRKSCPA